MSDRGYEPPSGRRFEAIAHPIPYTARHWSPNERA